MSGVHYFMQIGNPEQVQAMIGSHIEEITTAYNVKIDSYVQMFPVGDSNYIAYTFTNWINAVKQFFNSEDIPSSDPRFMEFNSSLRWYSKMAKKISTIK